MSSLFGKLGSWFRWLRGQPVEINLRPYQGLVARINDSESRLAALSDDQLRNTSATLRGRAGSGAALDGLLVEGFAVAREAARRVLGLRPFDVQLLAAVALHQGQLAEMQTGEGKTLAAVLPAYLNALTGAGVHVLTFNDYLACRDADWMGPIYTFLGLRVVAIRQGMSHRQRQDAYRAHVTYVTAKEAGFDFLRDHLARRPEDLVHRPFHFAIVDEADSLLIDEARVPLVLAGSTGPTETDPVHAAAVVASLQPGSDYQTDARARNVNFTAAGLDRLERRLGCGDLHASRNLALLTGLNLALHAAVLLRRDVDYLVRDGQVELIDEFTGRVVPDRRWPDGLQAAIEAKEGVNPRLPGTVLSSITLQHFLRLYPKVAGMTATAQPAAEEFEAFYGMRTVVIPPNRPCVRSDAPDIVFTHREAKVQALVQEIARCHSTGRPVLVGTASIEESEHLATALARAGVPCQVLNARNEEHEAQVIRNAGALGAVTISTNMAGRGTDIRLGGASEADRARVAALGGLYVIGTNRHESRRIDDQLRGRAGRQGDPGSSRFFISLEDDLIRRYGIAGLIPAAHRPKRSDVPVEDSVVHAEIARAQRIIEGESFEVRKTLRRYSVLLEEQRQVIHRRRLEVLRDAVPLNLLATRAAERYTALRAALGEEVLRRVEKQLTLYHLDQCWAEHLAWVAELREGIYLFSLGGFSPLEEFQEQIARAFRGLLARIDERIVASFRTAEVTASGIDLEKEGLRGPSSTWTYLVNDAPLGSGLERICRGLVRLFFGKEPEDLENSPAAAARFASGDPRDSRRAL
jgi:preprotein translocase subunit SecA